MARYSPTASVSHRTALLFTVASFTTAPSVVPTPTPFDGLGALFDQSRNAIPPAGTHRSVRVKFGNDGNSSKCKPPTPKNWSILPPPSSAPRGKPSRKLSTAPSTLKPLISGLLLHANLLRGRGILAKTLLKAGTVSPSYTPVYAALVAVIFSKLPEIGELVLTRMIVQFRRCYSRSDKGGALGIALFLGQLMNQGVAHELLGLQLVTLLLEDVESDVVSVRKGGGDGVSADGVEIVVAFMRIVGVLWSG